MKPNKYHLYYWLFFSLIILILDYWGYGTRFNILRELTVILIEIWIFYSFLFSLINLKADNFFSFFKSFFFFLFSFFITLCLNYFRGLVAKYYGINIFTSRSEFIYDSIVFYIQFGLYSIGYFLIIRNSINHKRKEIILEQKNLNLQKNVIQSELNFLRAQINPHFLQNCLNFIYSDTRKTNPNAADAVLLLSNIMRYSVADNSATEGMALLKDEITQVENVIQIHQLRFKEKLHIVFNKEGNFEHKQIVPMILLTLAENLIKYGDLNDSRQPARIDCRIAEKENKIYFSTTNKKVYSNKIISTGLGLKNIRDRLNLICEDNFTLEKEETEDWYIVKLLMPYKNV